MVRQAIAKSRQVSVGIVGGGFAGLRCADVLIQHGFKVTILEARNRLGGRVAQSNHLGYTVDLGPNWIHGSNDNPILHLAKKTNTVLHNLTEDLSLIFDSDGRQLDDSEAGEYASLIWDDGLISQAFAHSNAHRNTIDPKENLAGFFREKASAFFTDLPSEEAKHRRTRLLQYTTLWGSYVGSNYDKQSLRNFWLEETIEGENPFVAETYAKISDAVAAPAKKSADIRLNAIVKKIGHGRRSASTDSAIDLFVRTGQGEDLVSFDEVIVTAPLGWLKRNKFAFEPELEPRLAAAIDNIGYGTLDKIYVTFPSAFWNHGASGEDHTSGLLQWLQPAYSKLNPQGWGQQAINLASLPSSTAQPTLLFYVYGDCAAHVGNLVSSSSSKADADARLLDFIRPYYSLLPNFDANEANCKPAAVLATTWVNDEFAGHGSYSNFQIPLENGAEDIKVMRHGMPDGGLWLAGEHTAPFIAMGTSTGAYWSGEAVANRIAKAYGLASIDNTSTEQ